MGEIISSGAVSVTSGMTLTSPDVIWEGKVLVSSGGKVVSATVSYGGLVVVSSGGTATYARIADSATAYVLSGAVMYAPTVRTRSGFVTVQGGSVYSAVLESGGSMNVSGFSNHTGYVSGARLVDNGLLLFDRYTEGTDLEVVSGSVTVAGGGHVLSTHLGGSSLHDFMAGNLIVSSGGTADRTITTSDGLTTVSSGGLAREAVVSSGGELNVSSGGTASGVTAELGGEIYVASGGTALRIKENGGYVLASDENVSFVPNVLSGLVLSEVATVHSGTTATETILNTGVLYVYEGGSAEKTMINSGRLTLDGGTANSTTVFANFTVSGGTATSTTVHSGGGMEVRESGAATGVTINSGGGMSVRYGGSATDITVNAGAGLYVISGTALQVRENGGYVDIDSNSNVTFESNVFSGLVLDANATVHSGTTATDTTLNASGVFFRICSGGIANGTILNSGTRLFVSGGAQVDSTTVNDGSFDLFGAADHTTISGGKVWVSSGATMDNTAIAGGDMIVYSGATANSIAMTSGGLYVYGGTVNSATVNDGLVLVRGEGATANSTFVSGGVVSVCKGGSMNILKVYGGTVHIFDNGAATGVSALGGTVNVSSGITLKSAVAQAGTIKILSGGTAVANRATKSGRIVVGPGGALASGIAISSGGIELEGGAALATEVAAGGTFQVKGFSHVLGGSAVSNGIASNTRIHLGAGASVGSGGAMIDTVVGYSSASLNPRDPLAGGIELPDLIERAFLAVNSSGIANGVTASRGAVVSVGNQGLLISARIGSGASAQVMAGGSARTLVLQRGGYASIRGGATTVSIASAAKAAIGSGGIASGVTVSTGGTLRADAGALVADVSVASGGIVTGVFAGLAGQAVTLADGILDFDVSALGTDVICVEQLNTAFSGTYSCTLTVGDSMRYGYYTLAADAAGFNKTITVVNAARETLGTLTVGGGRTTAGAYDYTLTLSEDNVLSVRVQGGGGVELTGDLTSQFDLTSEMVASSVNVYTSGGLLTVFSGAVASETSVHDIGALVINKGGSADVATVDPGGWMHISSGGTATRIRENGGCVIVEDGADVTFTSNVFSGMSLNTNATVHSGTTATETTVGSGGHVYVYSGGTADHTVVNQYGNLYVYDATADHTTLNHGELSLLGGTANDTTLNGGNLYVQSGATANSTTVNSGWILVGKGATANNTTVQSGDIYVGSDCIANNTSVGRHGSARVNSGGTAAATTVGDNGQLHVSSGGTAIGAVVESKGTLIVSGGGTAEQIVENGGHVTVEDGATVTFTPNVFSGMSLKNAWPTVHSGTTATDITVQTYAIIEFYSGGSGAGIIENGGYVQVGDGAKVTFTEHVFSGTLYTSATAHSATTALAVTLDSGGLLDVYGGRVSAAKVESGGRITLFSGGRAENTVVHSGGRLAVDSGGTAAVAETEGVIVVLEGGFASGATVHQTGRLYVFDGGTVHQGAVDGSGYFCVNEGGQASGVTVDSLGSVYIDSGASADGIAAANGARVNFNVASDTYVHGTSGGSEFEMKDARLSGYTVVSSGNIYVSSGAVARETTAGFLGGVHIYSGGLIEETTVSSGGSVTVTQNGSANHVTVKNGGSVNVYYDGKLTGRMTIENGATVSIDSNGILDFDLTQHAPDEASLVNDLSLVTGTPTYTLTVDGAQANGIYKLADGAAGFARTITVMNTVGTAMGTLSVGGDAVLVGTRQYALKKNEANLYVEVTSASGSDDLFIGDVTGETKIISSGMSAIANVNMDGILLIESAGLALNTTVNEGGKIVVSAGGELNGLTVQQGGSATVRSGVSAGSVVVNGGEMHLESGAVAARMSGGKYLSSNTTVTNGGKLVVSSGAKVIGASVSENGHVVLEKNASLSIADITSAEVVVKTGATADNVTVKSGGILNVASGGKLNKISLNSGGILTGILRNASGLKLSGTLELNIANASPDNEILVDAASCGAIEDSIIYPYSVSLMVGDSLADGTYNLIEGAVGFDKTITVVNAARESLGTLTVGNTSRVGAYDYTLNLGDYGFLSVTVAAAPEPPAPSGSVKSDINANGISDVMFQYTGGFGQIGFWMDGTSTWQSTNATHPVDVWEVLGAYDMNANGKADSVLVGNTEISGIKGAFIGYYTDAEDYDSNWVNISYLTNSEGYVWKNKVGNLTGNAGMNSIVWHSTELGALGVWTDGTDSWIGLGAGYDSNWTLVGCGDFAGTGKDAVLMSYAGGVKYYTVDIDGNVAELATSDTGWTVRAIGDFSGDGRDDIVAFHKETGIVAMWGDGDSAGKWSQLGQLDAADWFVVGAGDYNGDQKDDLLVRQYSTGMLGYYASGDMSAWTELGRGVDMSWTVIA